MATDGRHIEGHYYPAMHAGWGSFAEELFHYTSRYFPATEAFLRNLVGDRGFSLNGYQAQSLSDQQRAVMAAILAQGPNPERAAAAVAIVEAVKREDDRVAPALLARFPPLAPQAVTVGNAEPHHLEHPVPSDVGPIDPFLNLAERLQMPVAVRGHHVEVSLHQLARHLDSGNTTLRDNLQWAVIGLHEAGFLLRNHPHLTHAEAESLGDDASNGRG